MDAAVVVEEEAAGGAAEAVLLAGGTEAFVGVLDEEDRDRAGAAVAR